MIRQGKIWLAAGLLAIGTSACFDDPTSDLRGGASQLRLDRSMVILTPDSTIAVLAHLMDAQGNTLPVEGITWTSGDDALVTVAPDVVNTTPGGTSARAFVTGVSPLGGATTIVASAGGFEGTLNVAVAPLSFPGTITNSTGNLLDTIVISGAGNATFSTATTVTLNGGLAFIVSQSATTLKVFARRAGTDTVRMTNVTVAGGALTVPINSSGTIAVGASGGDATEPANNAPDAVTVAGVQGATATAPVYIMGSVSATGSGVGTDADDFYTITTTSVATLNLRLEFYGTGAGGSTNPDLDLLFCDAGCASFVGGFGGATAANPETMTITDLPAGTYNIYVNGWNTGGTTFPYRITVWQN